MIFDEQVKDKSVIEEKLREQMYVYRKNQSPAFVKKRGLGMMGKDYSLTQKFTGSNI